MFYMQKNMILMDNKLVTGDLFFKIINCILEEKNTTQVVSFLNPYSYFILLSYSDLIEDIDYFFSDGFLLCKFHSFFYNKITRASFDYSSIAGNFFYTCENKQLNIALIGGEEKDIFPAYQKIKNRFKNLKIPFYHHGFFNDFLQMSHLINKNNIDVVVVGMGTPKQEEFSVFLKKNCPSIKLVITCGGFISQTALKEDYYYPIVKKLGLRWLQRAIMHKHVRHRLFRYYPKFIKDYIKFHI